LDTRYPCAEGASRNATDRLVIHDQHGRVVAEAAVVPSVVGEVGEVGR
jgi:hypothetical protein